MASADTLVLFTSAPPDRPQYIRDFLTCLASPDGQQLTFSYERKWIDDAVVAQVRSLRRKRVLVVFSEPEDDHEMRFLPLRWGELIDVEPREVVEQRLATSTTHIAMRFQLGRFLYSSPEQCQELWSLATEAIRQWPVHPLARGVRDSTSRWVTLSEFGELAPEVNQQTAWLGHCEVLSGCASLADCMLFRVSAPESGGRFRRERVCPVGSDHLLPSFYRMIGQRQYRVSVSFYLPESADPINLLSVSTASAAVHHTQPVTERVGREAQARIFFSCNRRASVEIATLAIEGRPPTVRRSRLEPLLRSSLLQRLLDPRPAESDEGGRTVYSPSVSLVMRFRPRYASMLFGIFLIAAGVFLSGLTVDEWKLVFASISSRDVFWLKGVGALIVVAGTFIAFRREPGGL